MLTIIRYPDAQRVEALVLSMGRYAVRVAFPQSDEPVELRLIQGQWTDEDGTPVEFESFLAAADFDIRDIWAAPNACAAAS